MKKKKLLFVLFLVFALAGIGVVTYAALVQSSVATSSSVVAKWRFKVNGSKETYTINLADNATGLLNGKIGPGSKGSFDIVIDGTGSQVGIDYSVLFENIENLPTNMIFYSDKTLKNVIRLSSYKIGERIAYSGGSMKRTHTIYWNWPADGNDNTDVAGKTLTFDIVVNAVQSTN